MQTELYPEPPVVILWPQDRPAFRREYSPSSFDGTVMIVNVRPGRYDELARYAMIVTIRTPGSDVDIYAPVGILRAPQCGFSAFSRTIRLSTCCGSWLA